MQTILGASGLIGKELVKAVYNYTKGIRIVSRHPYKINPSDQLFATDLTIPHEVFKAVEGSSVVYVTIGFRYQSSIWEELWPPFMRNVINACKQHNAKLIFFDNVYMYDREHIQHMTEDTPVLATTRKGRIRAEIANRLWNEIEHGNINAIIARSADFLGSINSIPVETIYKNYEKGKKAKWLIDDTKIHSFTYIKDAARATALLGNSEEAYNQIWHLPTDSAKMTGKDWIELFAKEMGVDPKYKVIPKWMLQVGGLLNSDMKELTEMSYQYDRNYFFDSSKFENHFDQKPTPAVEAVREVIKELRD